MPPFNATNVASAAENPFSPLSESAKRSAK
jgi:hypothetical protein